jgi:hypothetical protein
MATVDGYVKIKGRSYPFYAPSASGAGLFQINDNASPYLAMLVRAFPTEFSRALRALGYMLFKRTRQAMKDGGIGGTRWQDLSGVGRINQRIGDSARATRSRNPHTGFFGHLYKSVAYRMDTDNLRVQIGFLSYHSLSYGRKLQEGFDTPITGQMRRQFNAVGMKLSAKNSIHTPGRPLIAPVLQATKGEIGPFIEARIVGYLSRNSSLHKAA